MKSVAFLEVLEIRAAARPCEVYKCYLSVRVHVSYLYVEDSVYREFMSIIFNYYIIN